MEKMRWFSVWSESFCRSVAENTTQCGQYCLMLTEMVQERVRTGIVSDAPAHHSSRASTHLQTGFYADIVVLLNTLV